MTRPISLEQQRFGSLVALNYSDRSWRCRCDCGEEIVVFTSQLRDGRVTSCGCQPKTAPLAVFSSSKTAAMRMKAIEVVQRVVDVLQQTPLQTSRELATQIGVPYGSLIGVMNGLMRKGIIEVGNAKLANNHKTPVAQWRLVVPLEGVPSYYVKQKSEPREFCRGSQAVRDIGITEEDRQWMKHYRTQWQNRYRRNGQTPPISKFT